MISVYLYEISRCEEVYCTNNIVQYSSNKIPTPRSICFTRQEGKQRNKVQYRARLDSRDCQELVQILTHCAEIDHPLVDHPGHARFYLRHFYPTPFIPGDAAPWG